MRVPLLASVLVALSAGSAAADVTVGGEGRMGLHFDGEDWNFTSRVRVTFELEGETDGGLSFGGSIRADNAFAGARGAGGEVFISGPFGTLTMGDIDGAAEMAVGNVAGVGLTGLGDYNETFFLFDQAAASLEDPRVLYTYSFGGLSLHASAADGNGAMAGRGIGFHPPSATDDLGEGVRVYALGIGYEGTLATGSFTVGIGYEHLEGQVLGFRNEHLALGGSVTFGDTTVAAVVGLVDGNWFAPGRQFGLSVDHSFGAAGVTAFLRENRYDGGGPPERWLGLGARYDLGGGAEVSGGVVFEDLGPAGDDVFADLGVSFSF